MTTRHTYAMEETRVEGTGIPQTRLHGAERLAIRLGKISWPISLVINDRRYSIEPITRTLNRTPHWPVRGKILLCTIRFATGCVGLEQGRWHGKHLVYEHGSCYTAQWRASYGIYGEDGQYYPPASQNMSVQVYTLTYFVHTAYIILSF